MLKVPSEDFNMADSRGNSSFLQKTISLLYLLVRVNWNAYSKGSNPIHEHSTIMTNSPPKEILQILLH